VNVLVVLAHPEPRSFNGAMRDSACLALREAGHVVRESDLYAMRWQPVLGPTDFAEHPLGDFFNAQNAQRHAVSTRTQATDVTMEQDKLAWADLVIVIFPVWWFGVPAILKGWIDRVLAVTVAYGGGRWFDQGVYRGKRVLLACSTGAKNDRFSEDGLFGPIDWILHPLRVGTFNFCGFDTLPPFISWAAGHVGDEGRQRCLGQWRQRLSAIEHETAQPFRHLTDFPSPAMRDHS